MSARRFGERLLTVGIAAGLAVLVMGAGRRVPDPIAGTGGGPKGKSGSLDASFAGDGALMTFIPPILEEPEYNTDVPYAVAIDSRGGILVAGLETTQRSVVERFNADGTLDTTFGTDGLATFPQQGNGHATCLAVQPDGRILLAGGSGAYSALARFMPDGSLDPSFGQGGFVDQVEPRGNPVTNMALLPDGRVVLAGGGVGGYLRLARYESNGLPDNTFGTNGVVATSMLAGGLIDMAPQADGRLVFVFFYIGGGGMPRVTVARFNEDGSLDAGFGSGGTVLLPFLGQAVVVQRDGKIVVGGASTRPVGGYPPGLFELLDFEIARLHPDGSLDESFGGEGSGLVTTRFNSGRSEIRALELDAQGRLIAAGAVAKNSGATDFALARYETDGRLDLTFGNRGKTTADVDRLRYDDAVNAIAVQPDGRLVVVGQLAIDRPGLLDGYAWGLARFLP